MKLCIVKFRNHDTVKKCSNTGDKNCKGRLNLNINGNVGTSFWAKFICVFFFAKVLTFSVDEELKGKECVLL